MNFRLKSTLKSEEIPFDLPDNWTWYKWGDLISEYQQGLIRSNGELVESGVPYLKMNNLDNDGGYDLNKMEYAAVTDNELEKYKLRKGDFLLNVRNSKELVGKTCVIGNHNFDIVYNHMLVRIKHHQGISGSYINALLKVPVMRKFVDRCKSGTTTVIALYQRDLYEIPIPLPDKSTHDLIVAFVENNSSKIELNNRINAELESMAKIIYDYWFVQFDFPDKNGKPYKSSGGKMVWNEELKMEIPDGWEVKDLGRYASIKKGILITEKTADSKGKIKVVSAGIDYSYFHSEANCPENTITISASGASSGYINFWREPIFACDCTTVRGKNTADTLQILGFLKMRQEFIYKQARGSAHPLSLIHI
jgi:type I restriction enzyme S subunit